MKEQKLQSRYANSLYTLAKERNIVEQVCKDMRLIEKICIENRDFQLLLKNPVIKPLIKKRLILALFKDYCEDLTIKFLTLIVEKRREIHIEGICKEFLSLFDKSKNIKQAYLVLNQQVSNETLEKMKEHLEKIFNSKIVINVKIDEEILGGFSLMIDGKLYDASFKNKLSDVRKELLQS